MAIAPRKYKGQYPYRKSRLVVVKKEWGNILSHIYTQHVCPAIYKYKDVVEQYMCRGTTILMEDGASSYTARITKALYNRNGLIQIKWLANPPDLNPIKNIWRLLKYRVGKQFPKTNEEDNILRRNRRSCS